VTDPAPEPGWATATTLAEALPFIQIYDRQIVVIKYGGHAMGEEHLARLFAADAVLLKLLGLHPVVVHGGGPQISATLAKAGVKSTFVDGLRVTDQATMEIGRHQQGDRQLDHPGRNDRRCPRRGPFGQGRAPDNGRQGHASAARGRPARRARRSGLRW
jgi:hypothetical protein